MNGEPSTAPPPGQALPPGPLARALARADVRLLLAVGITAVSFAAILIRVADAPAVALAFWRSLGGAVALAGVALRQRPQPRGRDRSRLLLSGALLAVHFALFIGAFAFASVASVVTFAATSPIFVGLGSWLFLRQSPSRRVWAGIAVAAAGAVVIGVGDAPSATASNPVLGNLMSLGGAVAVSGYLLIGQRSRERMGVATYGMWVYGTAAVVLAVLAATLSQPLVGFDAATWAAIVGLILGPQLLGHTIFNLTLDRVPATTVAVVVLSEPIGAGLLAFVLLGEVPSAIIAAGAPLLLAGVYLAASSARPGRATTGPGGDRRTRRRPRSGSGG